MPARPIERRIRDASGSDELREARAARLLAQLAAPLPLSELQIARTWARLRAPKKTAAAPLWMRLAIAGTLLVALGAAAAIGSRLSERIRARAHRAPAVGHSAPDAAAKPESSAAPARSAPSSALSPPPSPAAAPAASHPDGSARAHSRSAVARASAGAASSANESALLLEARELAAALALRQQHDLAGEAAALQRFRAAHPSSSLAREASLAELDVELALGRRAPALALLDALTRAGEELPRAAELRLLRAELLAQAGRCAEALAGFDGALDSPALGERALFGRANCDFALGDEARGRSDAALLLSRYPHGALADEARRAWGTTSTRRESQPVPAR